MGVRWWRGQGGENFFFGRVKGRAVLRGGVWRGIGRGGRGRWGRGGEAEVGRGCDAEHVAEGAQEAAGAGDGAEEFGAFGAGEEVVEMGGAAGGGVAHGGDEPGLALREAGFGRDGGGTGARGREGCGGSRVPACQRVRRRLRRGEGAADVPPGLGQDGGGGLGAGGTEFGRQGRRLKLSIGAGPGDVVGDGGAKTFQYLGEVGGDEFHSGKIPSPSDRAKGFFRVVLRA